MGYFNQLIKHSGIKLGTEVARNNSPKSPVVPALEQDEQRVVISPSESDSPTSYRVEQVPTIESVNSEQFPSKEAISEPFSTREVNSSSSVEQDSRNPLSPKEQDSVTSIILSDNSEQGKGITSEVQPSKKTVPTPTRVQRKEIIQSKVENTKAVSYKRLSPTSNSLESPKSHSPEVISESPKAFDTSQDQSKQLPQHDQSQTWQSAFAEARAWVSTPSQVDEAQEKIVVASPPPITSYDEQKEPNHALKNSKLIPSQEHIHQQDLQLSIGTISLIVEAPPEIQPPEPLQPRQVKPINSEHSERVSSHLSRHYLRER